MNRPSSPPLDDRERVALFEAMESLDDRKRALLLEHYFEKVPLAELGERRGISAVAIWKRIDRARERLKKTLLGAGLVITTSRVSEALESTVPATAPAALVGEALLGKILAGGLALGATKSSAIPAVVVTLMLLFVLSIGGFLLFRSEESQKPLASSPTSVAKSEVPQRAEAPATSENAALAPVQSDVPKSVLGETLGRYRAWYEQWKLLVKTPPPPDDPMAHLRFQNEGWKGFKEAYAQINEDPGTFLKFVQDPVNDELLGRLFINLLGKLEALGQGTGRNAQYYKDFSPELMDGMVALAKSGTPEARKGILTFLGAIHNVPQRYDDLYEELMYDPDPFIQYLALNARWRQRPLDIPTLEKILARFESSTDSMVRKAAISAISYSPKPETFRWILHSLEADRDPDLTYRLASAAASMSAKLTPDAESSERLIRNLIATFGKLPREQEQNWLLYSVLYMPVKESTRVLEAVLPKASTPKLKKAIQSTLEKAAEGSSTWNDLQNHFWRLMKD